MKNYKIEKSEISNYEYIVHAINCDSPLMYIKDVEDDLRKLNCKGNILFDLLLSNGMEVNRFVEMYFDGNYFDYETAKNPEITNELEECQLKFLKKHPEYINKGVLSSIDIFDIKLKLGLIK